MNSSLAGSRRGQARWWRGTFGVLTLALGYAACGPAASADRCTYEGWAGECQLRGVTKIREIESFPRAYAVFEVAYEPMDNESPLSPPTSRFELSMPADAEDSFRDHLATHARVACRVAPDDPDACRSGRLQVAVPPYQPPAVAQRAEEPVGCRALEARGVAAPDFKAGRTLSHELDFEPGQSAISQALDAKLRALVAEVQGNPKWQCVAVTGFVTYGEDRSLAEARARAVKQRLVELGVEASRLVTFGAALGAAPEEDRIARPEERRVRLKVLIER